MLFKFIPLALCAMSFVQAIPFSDNRNSAPANSKKYKITNVGNKGFTFAGTSGELLSDVSTMPHSGDGVWVFEEIGLGSGKFKIRNFASNMYVAANATDFLVARSNFNTALVFYLMELPVGDAFKIQYFGQNLVWEGIYAANRQHGSVALRARSTGNQDWVFTLVK
ncbi:hypothetical protein B0H14DRAFT_2803648 [Mycena olivaceomarginata]|nr:hypothetical protein B0H14DRAFT_2803648 [Mycena olivaceomarginata]